MTFQSKFSQLHGTAVDELEKQVNERYRLIQKHSPRRVPYVRSKYFRGEKVFVNFYWSHIKQKPARQRLPRLKLFVCAIDLIQNNTTDPIIKHAPNQTNYDLYRFYGITQDKIRFCVQLKVNTNNGKKYFISVFPSRK